MASEADTAVHLRDTRLRRVAAGDGSLYEGACQTPDFGLSLQARSTQPVLLQGQAGYSRKGPQAGQASHYYSQPQLAVQARVQPTGGPAVQAEGRAWLDHEWSESVLDPQAAGWDWVGMNLDDGRALMAFQIRDRQGGTVWAGGSWREPGQPARALAPGELRWTPTRH